MSIQGICGTMTIKGPINYLEKTYGKLDFGQGTL